MNSVALSITASARTWVLLWRHISNDNDPDSDVILYLQPKNLQLLPEHMQPSIFADTSIADTVSDATDDIVAATSISDTVSVDKFPLEPLLIKESPEAGSATRVKDFSPSSSMAQSPSGVLVETVAEDDDDDSVLSVEDAPFSSLLDWDGALPLATDDIDPGPASAEEGIGHKVKCTPACPRGHPVLRI